jgi:putative ABC transport system permease protein
VVSVSEDLIAQYLAELRASLCTAPQRTAEILAEAEDHLRESAAASLAAGRSEREAQEAAISAFGSVPTVTRANSRPDWRAMFFMTYLRGELRHRIRQTVFVALGLALGIGLVITVSAASAGVKNAQADVLSSLYGIGTNVTVTGSASPCGLVVHGQCTHRPPGLKQTFKSLPDGETQICQNGRCQNAAGMTFSKLGLPYSVTGWSSVAAVARLHDVSAAAGGLVVLDNQTSYPGNYGQPGGALPQSASLVYDGVDIGRPPLGPLSAGTITSGHSFTAADASSDVAVVDSGYAASDNLKVGSTTTIDNVTFTVIGIVRQPPGTSAPEVYIPLARAQEIIGAANEESLTGDVNEIYVTAASAADIPAVQHEISRLLPGDTVTAAASLASQVTGALSGAAKLATDLGRWLAVLVLIAAFAVASLLTLAAVARRSAEFGTLKAIGWQTVRIVAQVLGEALAMGVAGATAGIGLGCAGAAIIAAVAPTLHATVPASMSLAVGAQARSVGFTPVAGAAWLSRAVAVPMTPAITAGVILLAATLALAGGLLAGSFASWRIARLRPASALARVA